MKMLSQLTRQAMSRHRLILHDSLPAQMPPASSFQPVRPIYPQNADAPAPQTYSPPPAPPPARRTAYTQQRPRTIYSQLMKNHDRMSERHLSRT